MGIKEDPQIQVKQVQKSIPKYEMKNINNVITVGPKYMEHLHDIEEEVVETQQRGLVMEPVSAFDAIDTNHDGVITRSELAAATVTEPVMTREFIQPATVIAQPAAATTFATYGAPTYAGGYVGGGTVIGGTTGGYVTGGTLTGGTVIGGTVGGYVGGG